MKESVVLTNVCPYVQEDRPRVRVHGPHDLGDDAGLPGPGGQDAPRHKPVHRGILHTDCGLDSLLDKWHLKS